MAKKKTSKKTSKKTTKKAPARKATARKGPVQKAATKKLGPELRADRLVRLAEIEFGTLGRGEEELVRGLTAGRKADLSGFEEADRAVRPGLVRWLCVSKSAHKLADRAGLQLESATIDGAIDLNAADIPLPVRLRGCTIRGAFECRAADLRLLDLQRSSFGGLSGDDVRVQGGVFLRNASEVAGAVRLLGATIGGDLSCTGGTFKNENGSAIAADRAKIAGGVFMGSGFNAIGEVRLLGATIGGILDCIGGTFKNENGKAISTDGAKIGGDVFMSTGFNAVGEVGLPGATICGNLDCTAGTFRHENGHAIVADGAEISGDVFVDSGFSAVGEVRMLGATISGDLSCTGGTFKNENGSRRAIHLQWANIKGGMLLRGMASCDGEVDLTACRVNILLDDPRCWPERVLLERFVYGSIYHASLGSLEERRAWLAKHDATVADQRFDPQPYRQLADVLRRQGHERFANEIMFTASQKQATAEVRRLKEIKEPDEGVFDRVMTHAADWIIRAWYFLLEHLIGYGYRRYLPVMWLCAYIFIGSIVFSGPSWRGVIGSADPTPVVMQPTQGIALRAMEAGDSWVSDYPAFRPIAYSADAFLPLVNLHQETYWTPKHWLVKSVYLPFHIISGWVVTTLAAVSFTGLVRQEGK